MFHAHLERMKRLPLIKAILLIAGTSLGVVGCVVHDQPVYTEAAPPGDAVGAGVVVTEPPPAPLQDTIVAAPGPGFVWIGGSWAWGGGHWHWDSGHWARPPHPGAVWVPHRYYSRHGRQVWVHGGWR